MSRSLPTDIPPELDKHFTCEVCGVEQIHQDLTEILDRSGNTLWVCNDCWLRTDLEILTQSK